MANISDLTQKIIKFRDDRNWKQYHSPKDLALGILVEAGEFAQLMQYFTGKEQKEFLETRKEDLGDELVDVLWWVLLAAHDLNIDLEKAFANKLQKNNLKYPNDVKKEDHVQTHLNRWKG